MKVKIIKNSIYFIVLLILGISFELIMDLYKNIIFDRDVSILSITLFSGLFGFMVAVIPFAIQLFNQDNVNKKNDFLNKLMTYEKFNSFVKPMFNRFIKMLYIMFCLFIYLYLLNIIEKINLPKITFLYKEIFSISLYKIGIFILFYIYLYLIIEFFIMLRNIIRDLQTLVFIFFKIKDKR